MDKFYTNKDIARYYVSRLLNRRMPDNAIFLEPSAGDGAFYSPLIDAGCQVLGLDIEPAFPGIVKQDFFRFNIDGWGKNRPIVTVGNPPFGKISTQAVQFFNHAANHSEIIAFILPRTFRKLSIQKQLNKYFHIVFDENLPKFAFMKDGIMHDVPCCWQIWKRKKQQRIDPVPPDVSHLINYTLPKLADFSVRRVGGRAGKVLNGTDYSPSSTYFIKEVKKGIREVMKSIDWSTIRNNTVGVRSISKAEIAFALCGDSNG